MIANKITSFCHKEWIGDINYTLSFVARWVGISFTVFLFYYLSRLIGPKPAVSLDIYGGNYFAFTIVGLAAMSVFSSVMNGFPVTVGREQSIGTLEVLLSTPTSLAELVCSFCFYNALMGIITAVVFCLLGAWLGADFSRANLLAVFIIIILSIVIFFSIGLLSISCLFAFKRGDPIGWITGNIFWLFGGLYFPVTIFQGRYDLFGMFKILLTQVFSLILLHVLYRKIWRSGLKKFTGVGQ